MGDRRRSQEIASGRGERDGGSVLVGFGRGFLKRKVERGECVVVMLNEGNLCI